MSFQEDRNEREAASASSINRNTSTDKDKPVDKPKTIAGVSTAPTSEAAQQGSSRPPMDVPKTSKPLQNRPIAPAAAAATSSMMSIPGAGFLPAPIPGYGHHMIPGYPLIRGPLGAIPPQHSFPHVPFGPSAAAISATAYPKGLGQIRNTTMSSAPKIPGMAAHLPGQVSSLPPQTNTSTSVTTTSRPSSPSANPLINSTVPFQSSEYKQTETRDRGSPHVPEITRKTSSPHCSSPSVQSSSALLTNTKPTLPTPAVHKPGQPMMLPHFTQSHNPLAVLPQPSAPPPSVAAVCISQNQPKPTVPVATIGKMYPSHLSLVPGRPGQPEGPASPDVSRLSGKQSTPASPVTIQQHSTTSTVPSSTHLIAASTPLQTSAVVDGRVERPHPGVSLPSTMMPNPMYPQYVFSEPGRGYPFPFPHSGFSQQLPSGIRPPHTQTTAAMQGMRILDQQGFFAAATNTAIRNLGTGNITSDALGSVAIMDSSAANPMYSMIGMQQAPNLQIAVSSSNPNATSPRPSILRKRTSEGIRKPAIVPYNNDVPAPVTSEPSASPRSDSTLSAPQSGQSSPKPSSDAGNHPDQQQHQPQQTATPTTSAQSDQPTSSQPPSSPVNVKKEQNEPAVSTAVSTAVTSSAAIATSTSSTVDKPASVTAALPDGASPRKKPRKQNVVVTEDKYGSSVPLEEAASSDDEEKKPKQPVEDPLDDDLKFILRKRPKISIFGGYKMNTKAAHNHFMKYSDVRIKEERKPTVQDIANQKGILHRVSGWRVHHVAAQMDDLSSVEQQVLQKLFEFRENLPKPRPGQKTKYHDELIMLDELVQGNIQRSQLVAEQLADIRKGMVKVLDHRPRCVEILQKYMNKRNPKKKN